MAKRLDETAPAKRANLDISTLVTPFIINPKLGATDGMMKQKNTKWRKRRKKRKETPCRLLSNNKKLSECLDFDRIEN